MQLQDLHVTRQALHYALDLLDSQARIVLLNHLESKYALSLGEDISEISRADVDFALREFFGAGADLLMNRYDRCLQMSAESRSVLLGFM